ncbi:Sas10 C-terminal domain-containing protein [Thamnocephalis sphaerospora]|uniref:Sas10 C-terminal domain-containing protein n=1 Tax=Thamnocephalis sphaerospora TaxID=78915 RepID=A0A4P9XIT5_9FUNG|nr:Sas10 C-terminal domain-containing protein [Thamnocephalis sphaerospora]|eukprot:RKP05618.1 Sas10 C-terminal domain-containing protein [Thamnocephalis sphaerospora]
MAKGKKRGNSKSSGVKEPRFDGGGASVRAIRKLSDVELDSEDECNRNQVLLDGQDTSDDSDAYEHDQVMDLGLSDEEDEDRDEDGDEDEEDAEENGADDVDERAWGSRKSVYYDADDVDQEENAREEEQEALRIQRARVEAMHEEDFMDEFAGSMAALSAKGARPGVRLGQNAEDDHLMQSVSHDLDRIDLSSAAKSARTIIPAGMTASALAKMVQRDAPELLELLPEFEEHFTAAVRDVLPIVQRARKQGIDAADSTVYAFLETKYRRQTALAHTKYYLLEVLMTYLANITFYLAMKAENLAGAQDHPVLDVLVKARTTLEELEALEEAGMDTLVDEFDAMLAELEDASESEASDEEDESEDEEEVQRLRELTEARAARKSAKKAAKQRQTLEEQLAASERFLAEYGGMGSDVDMEDAEEEEEEPVPETAYVPIASKPGNRKRKVAGNDFGDLAALDDDDADDKQLSRRKQLRQYAVRVEQMAAKRSKQEMLGGDHDLPYRDRHAAFIERQQREDARRQRAAAAAEANDSDVDGKPARGRAARANDSDQDSETDAVYAAARARVDAKREAKAAAKRARLSADPNWVDDDALNDDAKRSINYQILKNKGLAPKRGKDQRNPRVKNRKKFAKAQKKLKSVKATATTPSGAYGGESTGIKTGVSRSVRF